MPIIPPGHLKLLLILIVARPIHKRGFEKNLKKFWIYKNEKRGSIRRFRSKSDTVPVFFAQTMAHQHK